MIFIIQTNKYYSFQNNIFNRGPEPQITILHKNGIKCSTVTNISCLLMSKQTLYNILGIATVDLA